MWHLDSNNRLYHSVSFTLDTIWCHYDVIAHFLPWHFLTHYNIANNVWVCNLLESDDVIVCTLEGASVFRKMLHLSCGQELSKSFYRRRLQRRLNKRSRVLSDLTGDYTQRLGVLSMVAPQGYRKSQISARVTNLRCCILSWTCAHFRNSTNFLTKPCLISPLFQK